MERINKVNWGLLISLTLWCVITLIRVFYHSPWYDEAHAWLIAQELNLFEIIKLMKIEGHTFIWYLCLMPFAKTNFMYPYSMLLLNWLFCFIAILILWLKAPFNNWIKFLISFSFPFLALYPVVARCYSIGIMLLFALTAMENKKLEHPNWYALLLILCANTSIMAAVGATVFGCLFLYEMIKNKISIVIPICIMVSGAAIILLQLPLNLNNHTLIMFLNRPLNIFFLKSTFFSNSLTLNILTIIILSILINIFYFKNKIIPIFLILCYALLFSIFYFYLGEMWHHFFFYIYLIISCWLILAKYKFQDKKIVWKPLVSFVLIFVSLVFIFWLPNSRDLKKIWNCTDLQVSKKILADKNLDNSNIFVENMHRSIFQTYLKGRNINVINYCSANLNNWDIRPYYNSEVCQFDGINSTMVVLRDDYILKFYTDNSYFMTSNKIKSRDDSFLHGLKNYKFVLYKNYGQNVLWKIEKLKE